MTEPPQPPLYDPAFEHDACGVGFVADAGGRSRERVLPLALAGLGALGHRGAFAADGESSDGAGVSLPLERSVLERLGGGDPGRTAVVAVFLPRRGRAPGRGRRIATEALAAEGFGEPRWREVPVEPAVLGAAAEASRPVISQLLITLPARHPGRLIEQRLLLARRRMEAAARAAGLREFAVVSASARTLVYKGLVRGDRLAAFYPDLGGSLPVSYAIFHQRYATNTHPVWRLAQPFGVIAHNGEINTVRGNREQLRGRRASLGGGAFGRAVAALGPLTSPEGSDSLSLDETIQLLVAAGWSLERALLALVPEAGSLRREPHPLVEAFHERTAGLVAPWDGPATLVFADGRRVGVLQDRNGLRPAALAVTGGGIVAVASEAGAVPLAEAEIIRRGRLGPGELLLVDPLAGRVLEDVAAKTEALRRHVVEAERRPAFVDGQSAITSAVAAEVSAAGATSAHPAPTPAPVRYLAGLDAERFRLDIRTLVLEGHEPLWSMGDDTPTPGLARRDRRVADHLRQSFAQVTNPPIDPERERAVIDLGIELGRRAPLLGRLPATPRTVRLERPVVVDLGRLAARFGDRGRVVRLDATWDPAEGAPGLERALARLAADARRAAAGRAELIVASDRAIGHAPGLGRLPVPSVLAAGAIHTALTGAGLRGRADIALEVADVLDIHGLAMVLAAGATVVCPWLALELAGEIAGGRGAETLSPEDAIGNLLDGFDAALRKVLARMGISCLASYIGGQFFETLELSPAVLERCFPVAPAWPGSVGFATLARRQLRRRAEALTLGTVVEPHRLPDPGFTRFRADGEAHLYAPAAVRAIQALVESSEAATGAATPGTVGAGGGVDVEGTLERFRASLARPAVVVRDQLAIRPGRPLPLAEVEPVEAIAPRFVTSAMSLGSLSPEAHQTITLGIQRFGGSANTGEGGEDPAWYVPGPDGVRHDARIKQVASARFGVTAEYLARADQLEIKIAQGSKPGEGGQLPGRKATPLIAALRRGQPGRAMISPPPHHDIYSIEDLAQLIADLRAVNPRARIGVKLVSTRGIGTIAAGVVKAGADYIHLGGHAGGTGASPLSSIKHAGAPWELGLAETHQVLLRNGLRDRVALRVDGGLQTGRDLLVAALLGAEEFGFGTAALVAIGCDMARQCHLDTCPTGIATQRQDLRAKFTGTPEQVERFFRAIAEDLRRELAAIGARSVGEVIGEAASRLSGAPGRRTLTVRSLVGAPPWPAGPTRRADPSASRLAVERQAASETEQQLLRALISRPGVTDQPHRVRLTTADRSFGAALSGALERGEIAGPIRLAASGAAGQSVGAFLAAGLELTLEGQANDYAGKGLSGGTLIVRPGPDGSAGTVAGAGSGVSSRAIAGNTCLYGATGGRCHLVGAAGMRFAVRNSGAEAVVEGIGPHGCEYMTGGVVVVLGSVGANFGAGMTGGRAYLVDPDAAEVARLLAPGVRAARLSAVRRERADASDRIGEVRRLLEAHAAAGSRTAARLLERWSETESGIWLVEPDEASAAMAAQPSVGRPAQPAGSSHVDRPGHIRPEPAPGLVAFQPPDDASSGPALP